MSDWGTEKSRQSKGHPDGVVCWATARPRPSVTAFVAGIVRRVRRLGRASQRELADVVGLSPSVIGRIETGSYRLSVEVFDRILATVGLHLSVLDDEGRLVLPMQVWDDTRDGAGRRYPAHLDTILDPVAGEWWGDIYGLARPPETFHRDPQRREAQRRRSQWEVRVAQYRFDPPPPDPLHDPGWQHRTAWRRGA
ncbi:helix-turn-helix transcriptional regulator [Actinocatenispora sera]|jgi:transcriptional regulator with XRE-family HTH domain|uniref:helix-turn-helix domain-containing protein n=1 Tax=Actinocatenispora sera TaxID=390989 RepID=UPI0033EDD6CB